MKTVPSILTTAMIALLLSGCAIHHRHYNAVEPVSPLPPATFDATVQGDALGRLSPAKSRMPIVDNLQPTLSWKSGDSDTMKYDLMVCVGVPKDVRATVNFVRVHGILFYAPGEQVYYREAIEGNSHRIEQPLQPGTVYVWSVRTRNGSNVGPWSTYNFQKVAGVPGTSETSSAKALWWPFITPGAESSYASGQSQQIPVGQARIYFYREKRFVGSGMQPHILLNSEVVGNSWNGGYFHVDRPAGSYVVSCSKLPDEKRDITVTLRSGDIKYVETRFVSFHILPVEEDKDTALKTLSGCSYTPTIAR